MTLDVQREGGVSTKGPRGGVFVMYNCARLHTLFDSYERGVEKGNVFLKTSTQFSLHLGMEDELNEHKENPCFH